MKNKTQEEKVCPNCGFCPTCKRPKQMFSPWPTYPWYWFGPYYPYPAQPYRPLTTWGDNTGTGTFIDTATVGKSAELTSGTVSLPGIATTAGNDYGPTS